MNPFCQHDLVTLVPREDMDAFRALVSDTGGTLDLALTEAERSEKGIPHVFEFAYNHTTLQVLKADRSATYQQVGVREPADVDAVIAVEEAIGEDVWHHHEFARVGDTLIVADLPIIWFKNEERLREIDGIYAAHGFTVWDAHTYHVEGGGLKDADYRHLAWKKRMDPKGLLNPGKSRAWEAVRHLSADEIEAKAKD